MHVQRHISKLTLGIMTVLALASACAPMGPPALVRGDSRPVEGVSLAIQREGCSITVEPDLQNDYLVEERIALHVHNGAAEPVTVRRDNLRLLTPDGSALKTATWDAHEPITVAGGQDDEFIVRFIARGGVVCDHEVSLDPAGSVALGNRSVPLQPISFVPVPKTRGF
jgi:hypothetical protein